MPISTSTSRVPLGIAAAAALLFAAAAGAEERDRFSISIPPSLREELRGDRREAVLLVLMLPETRGETDLPADGPFWSRPHPFAAIPIAQLDELARLDGPIEIDAGGSKARFYPSLPEELEGGFRVQAALRPLDSAAAPSGAAIEWRSGIERVQLTRDGQERVALSLDSPVLAPRVEVGRRGDRNPQILQAALRSERLAAAGSAAAEHRAWVVFPRRYHDLDAPRRIWPAIFVIPHEGDGSEEARSLADAIAMPETARSMPQAVWVVLDPAPMRRARSDATPSLPAAWGQAVVEELLPHLERRFRIEPRREARLLWGHGAGGTAALRLLADQPESFDAAFATSPEAIDHRAIAGVDLAADSAFLDEQGEPRPAYREPIGAEGGAIRATIEQEVRMAETVDPLGRSGNRWHRLAAAMSPSLGAPPRPQPPFDPQSGEVDRAVAAAWRRHDLAAAVAAAPARLVPLFEERAKILCGGRDEFLNDRGVLLFAMRLAEESRRLGREPSGRSVRIVPAATFSSIVPAARIEIYRGMVERLRASRLHD